MFEKAARFKLRFDTPRGLLSTKALIEQLPECEKYLPKEGQTTRQLLAVANVLADMVAMGWKQSEAT